MGLLLLASCALILSTGFAALAYYHRRWAERNREIAEQNERDAELLSQILVRVMIDWEKENPHGGGSK